jgi:hypothetical protein
MARLPRDVRIPLVAFAIAIAVIVAIVGYVGYEHWWVERYD